METLGDAYRTVYKPIAALNQQNQAENKQQYGYQHQIRLPLLGNYRNMIHVFFQNVIRCFSEKAVLFLRIRKNRKYPKRIKQELVYQRKP